MGKNEEPKTFPKQQNPAYYKRNQKRNKGKSKQKKVFTKKESRSDREIREIEGLIQQINTLKEDTENVPVYTKFDELPISKYTKRGIKFYPFYLTFLALKESNFVDLTDIQKKSILPSLFGYVSTF